jgi:hypothetical protein
LGLLARVRVAVNFTGAGVDDGDLARTAAAAGAVFVFVAALAPCRLRTGLVGAAGAFERTAATGGAAFADLPPAAAAAAGVVLAALRALAGAGAGTGAATAAARLVFFGTAAAGAGVARVRGVATPVAGAAGRARVAAAPFVLDALCALAASPCDARFTGFLAAATAPSGAVTRASIAVFGACAAATFFLCAAVLGGATVGATFGTPFALRAAAAGCSAAVDVVAFGLRAGRAVGVPSTLPAGAVDECSSGTAGTAIGAGASTRSGAAGGMLRVARLALDVPASVAGCDGVRLAGLSWAARVVVARCARCAAEGRRGITALRPSSSSARQPRTRLAGSPSSMPTKK